MTGRCNNNFFSNISFLNTDYCRDDRLRGGSKLLTVILLFIYVENCHTKEMVTLTRGKRLHNAGISVRLSYMLLYCP